MGKQKISSSQQLQVLWLISTVHKLDIYNLILFAACKSVGYVSELLRATVSHYLFSSLLNRGDRMDLLSLSWKFPFSNLLLAMSDTNVGWTMNSGFILTH